MSYDWVIRFPGVRGIPKPFVYKYVSDEAFLKYAKNLEVETLSEKKVLGPRLKKDDVYALFYNRKVRFIAFPLTMYGELSKLSDIQYTMPAIINNPVLYSKYQGTNEGTHSIALLYDKKTKEIVVIDYEFGLYNIFYNYEAFMNSDLLNYVKPFLQEYGLEVEKVRLPMFRENRFYHLQQIMRTHKFPFDFSVLYKAYLANYVYALTHDLDVRLAEPRKHDAVDDFIGRYLELCRVVKEFPYDSKWIPLDISQTKLFEFTRPCPKGYMRDLFTGECVRIPEMLRETVVPSFVMESGKPVYPEHPAKWMSFIIRYFKQQYKNVAMLEPASTYFAHPYEFAIQFNDTLTYPSKHGMKTRGAKSRMALVLPKGFDDFMEAAIVDTTVRFIMCIVNIRYEGTHSTPILIDKDSFTIERIEVNAPFIEGMGTHKEDDLDYRLEKLFKSYLPDFSYIPPLAICPYGLHRAEYVERTENVADIGGRCAEWTLYYIHLKLANEDLPTKLLSAFAFEQMRKTGSIKHVITGYTTGLIRKSRKRMASPLIKRKPKSQISGVKSEEVEKETVIGTDKRKTV